MFNIRFLYLHSADKTKEIELYNTTYVHGQNSSGKTAMWYVIDYLLGSSKNNIYEYDGLQNIDAFSAVLTNTDTKEILYIKRNIKKDFLIKRDENSEFTLVSEDVYRDEIARLFGNIDYKYFEIYESVFHERLSYRAFSFLNLIGEKGLGDLSVVFTESKDIKHQIRIRDINTFLFNFDNVEKIYNGKKKLEIIEKKLNELNAKQLEYNFAIEKIYTIFKDLNIKYSGDIQENKKNFLNFKDAFVRKDGTPNKDLTCLQKASLSLAEEIKTYNFLKRQTNFLASRNNRIDYVLQVLSEIAEKNSDYVDYVNQINKIIEKHEKDNAIIALTDYANAIKKIEEEKRLIDEEIIKIKKATVIYDYEKVLKNIGIVENCFQILESNLDIKEIERLKNEKQSLQESIRKAKNQISEKATNFVGKFITESYLDANLQSRFAIQDSGKNLKIMYNPITVGVSAQKENLKGEMDWYVPGSMARQTMWQILTYLGILKLIFTHMPGLPCIPIILMDAIEQPFSDGANIEEIYDLIKKLCKEIGLQLIVFSKKVSNEFENKIDLNLEGLNPFMNPIKK